MGVEYYLVNTKDKSLYELGKGSWYLTFEVFYTKKSIKLDDGKFSEEINEVEFEEELLYECLNEYYKYDLDDGILSYKYIKYIVDGIIKFCNGDKAYLLSDSYDTYHYLYKECGYKETGSRFHK